jgi:hypothetical protein
MSDRNTNIKKFAASIVLLLHNRTDLSFQEVISWLYNLISDNEMLGWSELSDEDVVSIIRDRYEKHWRVNPEIEC